MPTFVPCFLCGTGRGRHRFPFPRAGRQWVCAFCDPDPAAAALPDRMADALVLAAETQPISVANYRRVCEVLTQAAFAGSAIVAHAEGAIRQAAMRLRAGELAGVQRARQLAGVQHGG